MQRGTEHVVCFTCGQELREPMVLNTLADGSSCPGCADRLLESLPPIFQLGSGTGVRADDVLPAGKHGSDA